MTLFDLFVMFVITLIVWATSYATAESIIKQKPNDPYSSFTKAVFVIGMALFMYGGFFSVLLRKATS